MDDIGLLFFLCFFTGIFLFAFFRINELENPDSTIRRKQKFQKTATKFSHEYPCIFTAKSENEFMTMPKGTLFFFLANDTDLKLISNTQPQ